MQIIVFLPLSPFCAAFFFALLLLALRFPCAIGVNDDDDDAFQSMKQRRMEGEGCQGEGGMRWRLTPTQLAHFGATVFSTFVAGTTCRQPRVDHKWKHKTYLTRSDIVRIPAKPRQWVRQ